MLVTKNTLRLRVVKNRLHTAVANTEQLWLCAILSDKRVILRRRAIAVQAHNTAQMVSRILRLFAVIETITQG